MPRSVTDRPRVSLLTRPGCHLCDDARVVVTGVVGADGFVEADITADEHLLEQYAEMIPVVLVDGEVHGYWRVSEQRLRAALDA